MVATVFSSAGRITHITLLCLPFTKGHGGKELQFSPENLNSDCGMIRGEKKMVKVSAELQAPCREGMKSGKGTS